MFECGERGCHIVRNRFRLDMRLDQCFAARTKGESISSAHRSSSRELSQDRPKRSDWQPNWETKTGGGRVVITRPPAAIRISVHIDSGGLQGATKLFDKVARNIIDVQGVCTGVALAIAVQFHGFAQNLRPQKGSIGVKDPGRML
jgi:hypothetical protein